MHTSAGVATSSVELQSRVGPPMGGDDDPDTFRVIASDAEEKITNLSGAQAANCM